MYLFPDYAEMEMPGKLKAFLADLYSGKLHREFHYGPDKVHHTAHLRVDNVLCTPLSSFSVAIPQLFVHVLNNVQFTCSMFF